MKPKLDKARLRRSIRILRAIHLLHKWGYEQVSCTFTAGENNGSWTLFMCHIDNLLVDHKHRVVTVIDERAELYVHSLGREGNEYFGWNDAKSASVEELANLIKERCHSLLRDCRNESADNTHWFIQLLGFVEMQGILPHVPLNKLYQDPEWTFSLGTPHFVGLPPGKTLFRNQQEKYRYEKVNIDHAGDWHNAHVKIINNITATEIAVLPQYPSSTMDVKEMGAYWEGAVYFVFKHLRLSSTQAFLLFLESKSIESTMDEWFYRIYNSNDQLDFFIAHVVRTNLNITNCKQKKSLSALQVRWKNWLRFFENKSLSNGGLHHLNPYYGGNNPLHLGGIFMNKQVNWLEN